VAALKAGMGVNISNDHFRLLAADHTDIPDFATEAGQRGLDPLLDGVDLLIIDNISTLCWTGSDNSAASWTSMQEWILRLRFSHRAIIAHDTGRISKIDCTRGGGKQVSVSSAPAHAATCVRLQTCQR
jgi:hypothetical protein